MAAVPRLDRFRSALLLFTLAFFAPWLAGCAVSLGPGYHLRREKVTVRYAGQPAPDLHYSVEAFVRNIGTRSLSRVRIQAPRQLSSQAQSAAAIPAPTNTGGAGGRQEGLAVPMNPPLRRRESRLVFFSHQLPLQRGLVFLDPHEWFPFFLPPRGLFAEKEPRAPKTQIDIFVPYGYRALTSGRLLRMRSGRPGGEAEYGYEIRERDFSPFLVIGKYRRRKVVAHGRAVMFWTNAPLESACASRIANESVETSELYRSLFGRLRANFGPLRVIEIAPGTSQAALDPDGRSGTVPNAVVFSESPTNACRQPDRFYFLAARSLAATWFGWAVRPASAGRVILGTGAQDYAALIAEENQEGSAMRGRQVADWLAEYDRLSSRTQPLPPGNLGPHPTGDQSRMAGVQSALSFVALEDRLGAEPVRRALKDLVGALKGSSAGRDELRSALEQESGKDLYGFFNQWYGRAGIPTNFRRRYAASDPYSSPGRSAALHRRREK
jgi:hypothetical protein